MVVPFALAVGVAMALGIAGAPILWVLATGAAGATLYMWNTRATPRAGGGLATALMTFAGLLLLMSLLGAAAYLLGRLFGWARLDA